jgi:hypothetical protein
MRPLLRLLPLLLPVWTWAAWAWAAPPPAAQCEAAIAAAEATGRLPPRLLGAIALVESGRPDQETGTLRPWPWTINAEGAGQVFATKADAVAAVRALQASGVRSIDVGCLQINLMFHPDAFATLEEAFDPRSNARYAARFLNTLYAAGRDWSRAIAAYHSETPALGAAYRALVLARWQRPVLTAPSGERAVYGAFAPSQSVYAAFAPAERVYGAFAVPPARH